MKDALNVQHCLLHMGKLWLHVADNGENIIQVTEDLLPDNDMNIIGVGRRWNFGEPAAPFLSKTFSPLSNRPRKKMKIHTQYFSLP